MVGKIRLVDPLLRDGGLLRDLGVAVSYLVGLVTNWGIGTLVTWTVLLAIVVGMVGQFVPRRVGDANPGVAGLLFLQFLQQAAQHAVGADEPDVKDMWDSVLPRRTPARLPAQPRALVQP